MDTSGKSQMTDSLARELKRSGEHVQVVHVDDFHQPRALRYRDDLPEPVQYYEHSFDFEKMVKEVLKPIREAGQLDKTLTLLDVPIYGEDVLIKYDSKYLPAQRMYLAKHPPRAHAHVIINNNVWMHPHVAKWPVN